jgi:transcriptional regulator with XRE-family HTH domain
VPLVDGNEGASGQRAVGETDSRVHPGEKVRRERRRQGMSLRELARRTGMTASHLSKVERGLANPSVHTLWMISDELGIPPSHLWAGSPDDRTGSVGPTGSLVGPYLDLPAVGSSIFAVEPGKRESIKMRGIEFQRLTPSNDAAIEFVEMRHEFEAGDQEMLRHTGREYGLVLSGRLLVEVGFVKHVLEPGWSIAFDSTNPHRIMNVGDGPAVSVWVAMGRNLP